MGAIEILTEAKGRPAEEWDSAAIFSLDERLAENAPFDQLKDRWIMLPGGGGRTSNFLAGPWAHRLLSQGYEPSQIVEMAARDLDEDRMYISQVWPMYGISLVDGEIVPLGDGFTLVAASSLPEGSHHSWFFKMPPFDLPIDSAALTKIAEVSPVLVDRHDSAQAEKAEAAEKRRNKQDEDFCARLRRALILNCDVEVEIPGTYYEPVLENLFSGGGSAALGRPRPVFRRVQKPDRDMVVETMRLLADFAEIEGLALAVDRLGRSRHHTNVADQAIEMGMALEIALMHGDNNNREEINHKLGLRAGWLLGADPASRLDARTKAGAIYGARSKAVHTGVVPPKSLRHFHVKEADAFVRACLMKILQRGRFPVWDNLVFGAEECGK